MANILQSHRIVKRIPFADAVSFLSLEPIKGSYAHHAEQLANIYNARLRDRFSLNFQAIQLAHADDFRAIADRKARRITPAECKARMKRNTRIRERREKMQRTCVRAMVKWVSRAEKSGTLTVVQGLHLSLKGEQAQEWSRVYSETVEKETIEVREELKRVKNATQRAFEKVKNAQATVLMMDGTSARKLALREKQWKQITGLEIVNSADRVTFSQGKINALEALAECERDFRQAWSKHGEPKITVKSIEREIRKRVPCIVKRAVASFFRLYESGISLNVDHYRSKNLPNYKRKMVLSISPREVENTVLINLCFAVQDGVTKDMSADDLRAYAWRTCRNTFLSMVREEKQYRARFYSLDALADKVQSQDVYTDEHIDGIGSALMG